MNETAITVQYRESQLGRDNVVHFHDSHELIFLVEGSAEFMIGSENFFVPQNSLLVVGGFERHYRLKANPPYKRYVLQFGGSDIAGADSYLMSLFLQRSPDFKHVIAFPGPLAQKIRRIFAELKEESESGDRFSAAMQSAKLYELLVCICRACPENFSEISGNPYRKIIYDAQNYLHNNFRRPITLSSVADHFFANVFYFSSKFKEYTGVPFKKYLINLCLADAKRQLLHTDKSVTRIAEDCGFNDLSNFIRTFQSAESVSPLKFRKKYREGASET